MWLQFLPQEQLASAGLLFNGDFESRPSGLPFDWVITAGSGVTIDLARRPDDAGRRALLVEFGHGRADFRGIAQFVMLPPGSYLLKGQYRGQLVGRRGLEWRISCAASWRAGFRRRDGHRHGAGLDPSSPSPLRCRMQIARRSRCGSPSMRARPPSSSSPARSGTTNCRSCARPRAFQT